jgi:hypothetical protein
MMIRRDMFAPIFCFLPKHTGVKPLTKASLRIGPNMRNNIRLTSTLTQDDLSRMTAMSDYWCATQFLCTQARAEDELDSAAFDLTAGLAEQVVHSCESDNVRAWAHVTPAELEVRTYKPARAAAKAEKDAQGEAARVHPDLRLLANEQKEATEKRNFANESIADAKETVKYRCRQIIDLKGPNSFHVGSTIRQFKRYADNWPDYSWKDIVQVTLESDVPSKVVEYDHPEDSE